MVEKIKIKKKDPSEVKIPSADILFLGGNGRTNIYTYNVRGKVNHM